MDPIGTIHGGWLYGHRVRALRDEFAATLPAGAHVLDVGCGDGLVDALVQEKRPDVRIEGIDILVRPATRLPVVQFDGKTIPYPDRSFDGVQFVDVLHHTDDPTVLLREAKRVARHAIVLKDHAATSLLASPTLRVMDWVGNARHGVVLPTKVAHDLPRPHAYAPCSDNRRG